mgnify:CR=1 FL=1
MFKGEFDENLYDSNSGNKQDIIILGCKMYGDLSEAAIADTVTYGLCM